MRTLAPPETLIYLETNDLAAALQPIVNNPLFERAAKTKPDLSVLKGVQLAVAVIGFETSEEKLTEELSVGKVQPRFVAIADTHAWNFQAVGFAEQELGGFLADIYGSEPSLEKAEKSGGTYFMWTAEDGRKAFALVIDGLIYFGNDELAIEKCLAVRRGEADSIIRTGKVAAASNGTLASGYVSTDGIAQIADIAGLRIASEIGEETEVQSAVARMVPHLIRSSLTDVTWTSKVSEKGIEDTFIFGVSPDVGPVFHETFAPSGKIEKSLFEFVPGDAPHITRYDLARPNIAWRGFLLTSQAKAGPFAGAVIGEFSNALLEPYGIKDAELFLSGVAPNVVTVKTDAEGEKPAVIATVSISENIRRSLYDGLKPDAKATVEFGVEVLRLVDDDLAVAFVGNILIAGNTEAVFSCLTARTRQNTIANSPAIMELFDRDATTVTVGTEHPIALSVADLLSEIRAENVNDTAVAVIETRFTRTSINRRTVSEFGLIGWIITQTNSN